MTYSGQVDIFDALTGKSFGTCGHADLSEVSVTAGDLGSDFIAVGHTSVAVMTAFRRLPKTTLVAHSKPIVSMVFVPRASAANAGRYIPTYLATCGSDRSMRVWDCELGALMSMSVLDYPFTGLCAGEQILFAACGYLSSKALTLNVLRFSSLGRHDSQSGISPRGGVGISGVGGKKAAKTALETTKAFDTPLRTIRLLLLCIRTRRGEKLRDPTGAIAMKLLLPHLMQPYHHHIASSFGPMRVVIKEGTVCAAVGCSDSIGVVTAEKCVFVWDIPRKTLVRSSEVHNSTITAVEVIGDQLRGAMIVTSSLDGTVVAASSAGDKYVVIKPTRSHGILSLAASRLASASPRLLFGTSTDGMVRAWCLVGAACVVGTQHAIARLSPQDVQKWLTAKGLAVLAPTLASMWGSELLNEDLASLGKLFGLTEEASATIQTIIQGASSGYHESAQPSTRKLSNTRRHSGFAKMPRTLSLSQRSSSTTAMDPTIMGGNVLLATQIYQAVQKLQSELVSIRESAYDNITFNAFDDAEITVEMVQTFTVEKLAQFLSEQLGMRCFGPFVLFFKITGLMLMADTTEHGIQSLLHKSYHDLAKYLYEEMGLLRGKARENFALKNPSEVALWVKQKTPLLQFILLVTECSGSQLATKTNFVYKMCIQCQACNKPIADASISCVLGGDHSDIAPTEDFETTLAMKKLVSLIQERFELMVKALVSKLEKLPRSHFTCGMNFHKLLKDTGYIAVTSFPTVPRASQSQNLLIDSATLTITVTENDLPRMVCIAEHHPKLLPQMAGLELKVEPCALTPADVALPPRWELSETHKSSGQVIIKYCCGKHVQTDHPTMPELHASRAISEPTRAASLTCRKLAAHEAREVGPPMHPKLHHFFTNEKGEQTYAAGWTHKTMRADVTDMVAASIERGDATINIFIVSQVLPPSDTLIADAVRPTLHIRYHDPEKLCACASASPVSAPLAKSGARQAAASFIEAPTLLCDRFCNIDSECKGHHCGFDTSKCKKAPYLLWTTMHPEGCSFQGVATDRIAHLSETNRAHMVERTCAPKEREHLMLPVSALGGTHLSSDDASANNLSFGLGTEHPFGGAVVPSVFFSAAQKTTTPEVAGRRADDSAGQQGQPSRQTATVISFEEAIAASGL